MSDQSKSSIVVTDIIDLEERTGIPAVRIEFNINGDSVFAEDWLRDEKQESIYSRQVVNLEVGHGSSAGCFVEMNAWDSWKQGCEYPCNWSKTI